jgi:hypothetical protein
VRRGGREARGEPLHRGTRTAWKAGARYAADRAERSFLACEPENRLVARSLEAGWEARLADLAEAEAALAVQAQARPELPGPDQLAAAIAGLPALWAARTTSDKARKRLLRTLLADVTITPCAGDPTQISVWAVRFGKLPGEVQRDRVRS